MDLKGYRVVSKRLRVAPDESDPFDVRDATDTRRYVQIVWKGRVLLEGPLDDLVAAGFLERTTEVDQEQVEQAR